ncbi:MAG: adenylate/guanylate cyclase domain-containing protein [Actinomycetota bacterium]|nr:adenylate/guanylate cyclase domain-containing protein [Actinomycetota bacterium]
MPQLPTGTVTFLFTDVEGSTRLLEKLGEEYPRLLEEHARLIRRRIEEAGGREVGTEGDAFFVVFASAPTGVAAAAEIQKALAKLAFPLRVRTGLHTGEGRSEATTTWASICIVQHASPRWATVGRFCCRAPRLIWWRMHSPPAPPCVTSASIA